MALFQKQSLSSNSAPLYTIGSHKTLLIAGLGNTGSEYKRTRHNIGFEVIEFFLQKNDFPKWIEKKDLSSKISMKSLGENRIILTQPTTYMNESGAALSKVQRYFRVYNQQTLLIYDELALLFGQLRFRSGGQDAGHNGVKSAIKHLGEDFNRLRIGINSEASQKIDSADFVLAKFSKVEEKLLPKILNEALSMIDQYIFSDQNISTETRSVT